MRLTPYFQIERQQAIEEGIQQGIQHLVERGIQQGVEIATFNPFFRLLTRKFGEISANLRERVSQLYREELESLADALLEFESVSDLENWLN